LFQLATEEYLFAQKVRATKNGCKQKLHMLSVMMRRFICTLFIVCCAVPTEVEAVGFHYHDFVKVSRFQLQKIEIILPCCCGPSALPPRSDVHTAADVPVLG
jgi:hypothetical protein